MSGYVRIKGINSDTHWARNLLGDHHSLRLYQYFATFNNYFNIKKKPVSSEYSVYKRNVLGRFFCVLFSIVSIRVSFCNWELILIIIIIIEHNYHPWDKLYHIYHRHLLLRFKSEYHGKPMRNMNISNQAVLSVLTDCKLRADFNQLLFVPSIWVPINSSCY